MAPRIFLAYQFPQVLEMLIFHKGQPILHKQILFLQKFDQIGKGIFYRAKNISEFFCQAFPTLNFTRSDAFNKMSVPQRMRFPRHKEAYRFQLMKWLAFLRTHRLCMRVEIVWHNYIPKTARARKLIDN